MSTSASTPTLPPSLDLTNRTAIVTGGSRGIGKGIALELARRGANIALTYTNPSKSSLATATVDEIKSLTLGGAIAIRADMKDPISYDLIVKETLTAFGSAGKEAGIDILVHNAAQMHTGPMASITQELYAEIMTTNVSGPFFLTQACVPHMCAGGRIIVVSSTAARIASMGSPMAVYAASKAAIEGLVRAWSYEFGSRGITVNAVAPGLTETEASANMDPEIMARVRDNYAKITPFGKSGTPDDVAQIVAFLGSEGSRWVTGSTLTASGGRVLL